MGSQLVVIGTVGGFIILPRRSRYRSTPFTGRVRGDRTRRIIPYRVRARGTGRVLVDSFGTGLSLGPFSLRLFMSLLLIIPFICSSAEATFLAVDCKRKAPPSPRQSENGGLKLHDVLKGMMEVQSKSKRRKRFQVISLLGFPFDQDGLTLSVCIYKAVRVTNEMAIVCVFLGKGSIPALSYSLTPSPRRPLLALQPPCR